MTALLPVLMIAAVTFAPHRVQNVATLNELGPALSSCFHAPDGSAGSQITILLSLTRSGAVLGKPRVTFSHLVGRPEDKRAFVDAVLSSLSACTPVGVTPGLGAAIAGRPLSIRFIGGEPARPI